MEQVMDCTEDRDQFATLRVQLICAWAGVALVVGFLAGWAWLAGMVPPTAPTDSPDQILGFFAEHVTRKRIGIVLAMSVWSLLVPWGAVVAVRTARTERGAPLLSIIQGRSRPPFSSTGAGAATSPDGWATSASGRA